MVLNVGITILPALKCGALLLYGFMSNVLQEKHYVCPFSKSYFTTYGSEAQHSVIYNVTYYHILILEHKCQSLGFPGKQIWRHLIHINWSLSVSCSHKRCVILDKAASFCQRQCPERDLAMSCQQPTLLGT